LGRILVSDTFFLKIADYILNLAKLPDIPRRYRDIVLFLKRTYDIHDIKGIQGQIPDKIRFLREPCLSGDAADDFFNSFQHAYLSLSYTI